MTSSFISGLLDFLFPKEPHVYELEALSPTELWKALPKAESGSDALFLYQDPRVRDLIWELKYRKNSVLTTKIAEILFDFLRLQSTNLKHPFLIPIPMSSQRRKERGWNQTEILCEEIKKLDIENVFEYSVHILKKIHHTESQAETTNKETRLKNVENSMRSCDAAKNRIVIVLDDVTTTGATFMEAKRALQKAGASNIICIAVAH